MPRLTRRSAGRRVLDSAQALSDDLLVAEEACFARIGDALTLAVPTGELILDAAWLRAKQDIAVLAADARLQTELIAAHRSAITSTRAAVTDLADDAVAASLDAIEAELGWVEQAVAKKYAGTAKKGVSHALTVVDDLTEAVLKVHADSEVVALLKFGDAMRSQVRLAAQSGDDVSVLAGRLFSVVPFRARGIGGRGVWHRSGSDLNASARGVCVGLMNQTRKAAMAGMNKAARVR